MRRMSANNHWGQEGTNFHKQAGYMRAMIFSHIDDQMSCKRSGSIYVGKEREQERKLCAFAREITRIRQHDPITRPVSSGL